MGFVTVKAHRLSGVAAHFVHVGARDADDLCCIADCTVNTDGVEKAATSLCVRELIDLGLRPLVQQLIDDG